MKIVNQSVTFIDATPNALDLIEGAARICYQSVPRDVARYRLIRNCISKGHESVLEHASATFDIICDRGISHQIVRHRVGAYSQESTRYCNYSKDRFENQIQVIAPLELQGEGLQSWERAMRSAEVEYFRLLKMGYSPDVAREVLPTSLKTQIRVTYNFREWRHFMKVRGDKLHVHAKVFALTKDIHCIMSSLYPEAFDDISIE